MVSIKELVTSSKNSGSSQIGASLNNPCIVKNFLSPAVSSFSLVLAANFLLFLSQLKTRVFQYRPFYSCVLSYLAMNASEVGVDLALIQTSLLFSCKCKLVSTRTT